MVRNRMLRVEDSVWEEFQRLSNNEGRFLGKMLEILVKNHKPEGEKVDLDDNNRYEGDN